VRDKDFDTLVTSIRQAGAIRRGERRPSRTFDFKPEDVRAIRENLGRSQTEFALLIGVSVRPFGTGNRDVVYQKGRPGLYCELPQRIRAR
jgi:hypothetical protein